MVQELAEMPFLNLTMIYYDLLVLVDHPVTLKEEDIFRQQLFPIEIETGCVLTLNVYHLSDWNSVLYKVMPFRQNVEREGLVI